MPMLFSHSDSPSRHIFERNCKTVYNKDLRENIHYNENSKIKEGDKPFWQYQDGFLYPVDANCYKIYFLEK